MILSILQCKSYIWGNSCSWVTAGKAFKQLDCRILWSRISPGGMTWMMVWGFGRSWDWWKMKIQTKIIRHAAPCFGFGTIWIIWGRVLVKLIRKPSGVDFHIDFDLTSFALHFCWVFNLRAAFANPYLFYFLSIFFLIHTFFSIIVFKIGVIVSNAFVQLFLYIALYCSDRSLIFL